MLSCAGYVVQQCKPSLSAAQANLAHPFCWCMALAPVPTTGVTTFLSWQSGTVCTLWTSWALAGAPKLSWTTSMVSTAALSKRGPGCGLWWAQLVLVDILQAACFCTTCACLSAISGNRLRVFYGISARGEL